MIRLHFPRVIADTPLNESIFFLIVCLLAGALVVYINRE